MKKVALAMVAILVCLIGTGAAPGKSAKDAWTDLLGKKLADRPEFAFVENNPALPNVLLYGDSISMGYTMPVRSLLRGKANVYRLHTNGNHSGKFIELMSEMRSTMRDEKLDSPWDFQWDVIHFNVGLHDLKYVLNDRKDKENLKQVSSIDVYKKNLHAIVAYLQQLAPNAQLIFATTTPVPEGEPKRIAGDAARYNKAAVEVLGDYQDITINDLYSFTVPNHQHWWTRPGNVHFNQKGSNALGDRVAKSIREALSK